VKEDLDFVAKEDSDVNEEYDSAFNSSESEGDGEKKKLEALSGDEMNDRTLRLFLITLDDSDSKKRKASDSTATPEKKMKKSASSELKPPKEKKEPKEKVAKEKKEKVAGPKRAVTSYIYFSTDKRASVIASNPGIAFAEGTASTSLS
jgi:hypothetical protein